MWYKKLARQTRNLLCSKRLAYTKLKEFWDIENQCALPSDSIIDGNISPARNMQPKALSFENLIRRNLSPMQSPSPESISASSAFKRECHLRKKIFYVKIIQHVCRDYSTERCTYILHTLWDRELILRITPPGTSKVWIPNTAIFHFSSWKISCQDSIYYMFFTNFS